MSQDVDEHVIAQRLVRSLLKRFISDEQGNYNLLGPVSTDDYQALALLAGAGSGPPSAQRPAPSSAPSYRFGTPVAVPVDCRIDYSCITATPGIANVVAIDFGTAFSKAALWRDGADAPTPLDLGGQVSERSGNLLPSSLYITDGVIYFGQEAIEISRRENTPARTRFDSPKQELSILEGTDLDALADARVDPSRQLTKRDLLTLYLAYLTAATSLSLDEISVSRHALRRFAVPVWKDGQVSKVAKLLKRLLVDAQILADSLPSGVWRSGLTVDDALRLLKSLRSELTDAQRDAASFVERHVLEAAAAAAAIGDHLPNKRPIALVVDVGAGTTDLGLYQFVLPEDQQGRIFPFAKGGAALKIAGDRLDALLISFIKAQAQLDDQGADGQRSLHRLHRDIRDHKIALFESGFLDLEDIGDVTIRLEDFLRSDGVLQFKAKLKAAIQDLFSEIGAESVELKDGLYVVLTGGGAKVSVFTDVFAEPFEIGGQSVQFTPVDVSPEWLEDYDALTQQIFPQLAVAVGGCSPRLPEEKSPITNTASAPKRVVERFQ